MSARLLPTLVTCMLPYSAVCLQTFFYSGHSTIEQLEREDGITSRKKRQQRVETLERPVTGSSFKFRSSVLSHWLKHWKTALAMVAGVFLHKLYLRAWTDFLEGRARRYRALCARRFHNT